jgi:hypothetical protein
MSKMLFITEVIVIMSPDRREIVSLTIDVRVCWRKGGGKREASGRSAGEMARWVGEWELCVGVKSEMPISFFLGACPASTVQYPFFTRQKRGERERGTANPSQNEGIGTLGIQ